MSIAAHLHNHVFRFFWRLVLFGLLLIVALLGMFYYLYHISFMAPGITATEIYIEIPSGSSASSVASLLEQEGIIRSKDAFLVSLKIAGLESSITSGTYYFAQPENLKEVIRRVTSSDYDLPSRKVTLFEGEANFKYAERLAEQFQYISQQEFVRQSRGLEGYLFPDTYTVPERITTDEIISIMRDNFDTRTASLEEEIAASIYSLDQIVTMASLVETEAGNASYETKQRVAGILWKRLEIGMMLQADAVFSYIYQEHLPRVLFRHLEVDSPYNLYQNTGLPPGPIGNPGLDSIRATLNPVNPEGYLYYLTGNDGKFYYAKTLARHEQNRRNHLQY